MREPSCGRLPQSSGFARTSDRSEGTQNVFRKGLRTAPRVGLEPTTNRLTAGCSTIELSGKMPTAGRNQAVSISFFRPCPALHRQARFVPAKSVAGDRVVMADGVVIVGAGLAGLAAATALAQPRVSRHRCWKSRNRLGGRAGSFVDAATGQILDACQHVSMGCCTNFAHFCRTVGIAPPACKPQPCLHFMTPDRRVSRLRRRPAAGAAPPGPQFLCWPITCTPTRSSASPGDCLSAPDRPDR